MRSIDALTAALRALAAEDVDAMSSGDVRQQVRDLMVAVNRLDAELTRRVGVFDARGLAGADAARSSTAWLRGFGRLSGPAAAGLVRRARVCRQLPEVAAVAASGRASAEHVDRVARLAERVGPERVAQVAPVLADAAARRDPVFVGRLCQRVMVHADPDGGRADAARDFARRAITLSAFDGMVVVHGQLDPEGGGALAAALDAVMAPPTPGDGRSAPQRRADALVELARGALRDGWLPTVGGMRPQVGILVTPQNLVTSQSLVTSQNLVTSQSLVTSQNLATSQNLVTSRGVVAPQGVATPQNLVSRGAAAATVLGPPPAHLEWVGPIPDTVARRIACDADAWRILLDPATGRPLDVGRSHRLVPHWIRKALHARDHGCRFPGCHAPAAWADAHHLTHWADGGATDLDNLILLCRYHHGLVHEAGWQIHYNPVTNDVTATRPDGRPYDITIRGPATDTAA